MTNKIIVSIIAVGAILGTVAFLGYSPFLKVIKEVQSFGSPAGTTLNTAKYAGVVMAPTATGANATTSSILNSDASDRYVTAFRGACNGLGTAKSVQANSGLVNLGWNISVGTTSASVPSGAATSSFSAVVMNFAIPTTTVNFSWASSTTALGASTTNNMEWPAGSYMTFSFNATTTSGVCTIGVDYIGS